MRLGFLVALSIVLAPGCMYLMPPSRSASARVDAAAAASSPPQRIVHRETLCRDVAQYEERMIPLEGEWTQPACTDCDEIRVCRAAGPTEPAECTTMTQADYVAARTIDVPVGTRRVCDEAAPAQPAPVYAAEAPTTTASTCPGGVTTSGQCCTSGCACGASCISCSYQCRAGSSGGSYGVGSTYRGGGPVQVRGYYRRDSTYVRPHTRRR